MVVKEEPANRSPFFEKFSSARIPKPTSDVHAYFFIQKNNLSKLCQQISGTL
jgi:hypothetical protein